MKKIALLFALFAGVFTTAMAQEETAAKDSVFVVKGDSVVGAYEIADGDYVTFARPEADDWHIVKENVKFYTQLYSYVNYSNIWQNGTKNEFAIDNFLGSNVSLYYNIVPTDESTFDATNSTTWAGGLVFTDPVVVGESWGYTWYGFYPSSESWSWTDAANNVTYDAFGFYGDDYAAIDASYNYLYLFGYFTVGGTQQAGYLYGVWN